MAVMPIWWTGNGQFSMPRPGIGSEIPSLPSTAISRSCSHGEALGVQAGHAVERAASRAPARVATPRDEQDVAGADA